MKEKIALINPNSPFLTNERVFPNIGLVRVATQLKADGYNVDLIDCAGRKDADKLMKEIANKYDVFGFSSTTPQFPRVYKMNKIIKKHNPNAHTVIGGAHPSSLYPLMMRNVQDINIYDLKSFDTIFVGEGELDNAKRMLEKGVVKVPIIKNIDDTLIPDKDFIDAKSYKFFLNGEPTTNIQTQRGCPHQCVFCSGRDTEMYNRVRMHSPERVLEELDEQNRKYGFNCFMWYDDEINLNMGRLEKLCEALSTRPYKHRGFIRSDNIVKYPESVQWMKDAGFVKLCAGVESGSNRMLEAIHKKTTNETNSKARELIQNAGIHYESFMLLGHPGETLEDVRDSYSWIKQNHPDDFDINIITPYPGSKMYDDAVPSHRFKNYRFEYNNMFFNKPRFSQEDSFYKGKNSQSKSGVRTLELSNRQLKQFRDRFDKELKNGI